MALLDIITFGDPVLSAKAEEITEINEVIVRLAEDMVQTLHRAPGVGLAAPQVKVGKRMVVVDPSIGENPEELFIVVNPRITESDGKSILEEGCLSVPEIKEKVVRPWKIKVEGFNIKGNPIVIEADDFLARVFCHEIDHLDGRLFIDRLSPLKRKLIIKKLKKMALKDGPGK